MRESKLPSHGIAHLLLWPCLALLILLSAAGCEQKITPAGMPPLLVSISPAPGAEVDPGLTPLQFEFDRPMQDESWSLVRDDGLPFPEIVSMTYSEDRRTLTVLTILKPSTTYQFWLNRGAYQGFRSMDGVPLDPYRYRIVTSAD